MESRYRVVRQLGQGGMATVYEATMQTAGGITRRVALKQLGEAAALLPSMEGMFLDEARLTSALHHPNIVSLLDFGFIDGRPFHVLELVDGQDAAALARLGIAAGEPMPTAVAVYIVHEAARGLDCAHTAKDASGKPLCIVHRDISPNNLLVSWAGEVKVADFGIALSTQRSEHTLDGSVKGKLSYMAPEQLLGGQSLDARADVFSLGCTLHKLLFGASPTQDESTFRAVLAGTPPPIDARADPQLRRILVSMLAPDREQRLASAARVCASLHAYLRDASTLDAREALVAWLARIRPSQEPQPAKAGFVSPLDALLASSAETPELRVTRTVVGPSAPAQVKTRVDAAPEPAASETSVLAKARASTTRWLAATGILLVVGVAVWQLVGVRTLPETSVGRAVPSARVPVTESVAVTLSPTVSDSPSSRTETQDAGPARVLSVRRVAARPRTEPASSPSREPPQLPVSPPTEPESAGTGTVTVLGPGATDRVIWIDGHSNGQRAPKRLSLPLGDHRLQLANETGVFVFDRQIRVTVAHTASPLVVRVEGPDGP